MSSAVREPRTVIEGPTSLALVSLSRWSLNCLYVRLFYGEMKSRRKNLSNSASIFIHFIPIHFTVLDLTIEVIIGIVDVVAKV